MKTISPALESHLNSETTTLATCWKITRTDSVEFFFTDHDEDIVYSGDTYIANSGYTRTAIVNNTALSVDNLEVQGIFDSDLISEQDLRAGVFDHAEVEIFLVNFEDLSQGILKLRKGWLGQAVLTEQGVFKTELRGLMEALQHEFIEVYQPECRAQLGDTRCGVDLTDTTFYRTGTVTVVNSRQSFVATLSSGFTAGYFDNGRVTWTSGDNEFRSIEVNTVTGSDPYTFLLYLPLGYNIQVGDTFTVFVGCDRKFETCRDKFDNANNFRGEPFIPGIDEVLQVT